MREIFRTLRDPVHFIAFGFGAGALPRAPGTFGSLVGLFVAWRSFDAPFVSRAVAVMLVIAFGIWLCGESARRLGRHDDPRIVFDEIAGVLLAALAVPAQSAVWFALLFVFFRFSISPSRGRSAMWITDWAAAPALCLTT